MLKPNSSQVPPAGFHFIQKSRLGEQRIEGSSYENVAEQVLRYRITNWLDLGDPLTEVFDYVCGQWPHFCGEPSEPVEPRAGAPVATQMSSRVLEWLARQADARVRENPFVPDTETQRRAEICLQCPNNVEWKSSGCGPCINRAQQLGNLLRGGTNPLYPALGACRVIGQDNATAARINNILPTDSVSNSQLPDRCWRKIT
jgi:hypothetical protein